MSCKLYVKEFTFDECSYRKQTIYQKLHNSNRNTISFIPHVCCYSYLSWIATSQGLSLTTLFSSKSIFLMQMLKTVSITFFNSELTRTLYSVWFLQICSGNNNTSLLLYDCKDIHLINKSVTSPYAQAQGGILLKFNILCLHYVTHHCT